MGEPKLKMSKRKILAIAGAVVVMIAVIVIILVVVLVVQRGCATCDDMAVASDNAVCTDIGADTLEAGGSGVDATIAILLCLGAVQPQSNGIGGGGFMLVHTKDTDKVVNFRERAPAAATENMFVTDPPEQGQLDARFSGRAVGVPGELKGYWKAHQMFGKLPWVQLFTPSITLLRDGITVTPHMENALKYMKARMIEDENLKSIFFTSDDEDSHLKIGDTFTNPKLADVYDRISKEGPSAVYTGSVAENIVKATKAGQRGGIMTLKDLDNYEATVDEPFKFEYRGQQVITTPPPASGHVIALVLQILDNFDLTSFKTLKAWNYILEAMRFGYAMRSRTGDVAFSELTKGVVKQVSGGKYAKELLQSDRFSDSNKDTLTPYIDINKYSDTLFENHDGTRTTHVSVMGPNGEAVSCTSTVNWYFGSCIMTDDGIVMNNEMDDFSIPGSPNAFGYQPSPENFVKPSKRPMSSSSPSIVFDDKGEAKFVTGAAGGSRIITGTLLSLINALDWKMSLTDNLRANRLHDQLNEKTYYEVHTEVVPLGYSLLSELSNLGYNMTIKSGYMSVVTSVSKLSGTTEASGDPRKQGTGRVVEPLDKTADNN